jgi:hypothetical protein
VSLHEVGDGGFQFLSLPYIPSIWRGADFVRKSLAEWCSRALGRRELLDHVIVLNERHLKRLLSEYVSYYHEDRRHLGLGKGTPGCRTRCETFGSVLSHDRLGGLHHRYDQAA